MRAFAQKQSEAEKGDLTKSKRAASAPIKTANPNLQIQRACACGGGCPKCKNERAGLLQAKHKQSNEAAPTTAPPVVGEVLQSAGQPLGASTREFMESRFGHDFGEVKIHTGDKAAESAAAVNALAYTVGRDIVFGARQYQPETTAGKHLLAHELAHVAQRQSAPGVIMRQTGGDELGEETSADADEKPLAEQCHDDAAIDAEYDQWLHYDAEKDVQETALLNRINKEVFGPINQRRNKLAADSFENFKAKEKAFPTGDLETGASPERTKLFNTPSYTSMHSSKPEAEDYRKTFGFAAPVGDLIPTGKVVPHVFGAASPPNSVWSYDGGDAKSSGLDFDMETDSDFAAKDNVAGFAEFKDSRNTNLSIHVPQLGFGQKPPVITTQIMCCEAPVVKPGRAKRLGGATGQKVTDYDAGDAPHKGKHFFGKGTSPAVISKREVLGQRSAEGKPVYWYFKELPADEDKREKIEKNMRRKADAIMDAKSASYENLKQYYLRRAAFIAKYSSFLE